MLDAYCNSLTDEAQLELALRLGKLALPVWETYCAEHPEAIKKVNALIEESNRVQGGAQTIDVQFPARALRKIEQSYENAKKKNGPPVPRMKSDGVLAPILATSMQPLTNPAWDETLPNTVRLVFTMVWNIATWLLYARKTDAGETHIYVAINQAADVIMTEHIRTIPQIEELLQEYKNAIREDSEDELWEKAPGVKNAPALDPDEIYRKIAGEKIIKDACGSELAQEVVRQMREEGKSYWDSWEEYYTGTCKTYEYNKEKHTFWLSEVDVIVASFFNEYPLTEQEMLDFIAGVSITELRKSGFEV